MLAYVTVLFYKMDYCCLAGEGFSGYFFGVSAFYTFGDGCVGAFDGTL